MQINDFTTKNGQRAVSATLTMRELPTARTDFPAHLKAEAARAASYLANQLADLAYEQRLKRDQVTGTRLDPRKRRAVGKGLRHGYIDPYELRPYLRRDSVPKFPSVGIVASAGTAEVGHIIETAHGLSGLDGHNGSAPYVMRVTQLTLALAWAFEAIQTPVYAALCEGHALGYIRPNSGYAEAQLGYMLHTPDAVQPLKAYSCLMNVYRFYGESYAEMYGQQRDYRRLCANLQGKSSVSWGHSFPSFNGGNAVHWMRDQFAPDIVISIGNNTDRADADVQLSVQEWDMNAMVTEVAQQVKAQLQ